jgi:hypothetical protein
MILWLALLGCGKTDESAPAHDDSSTDDSADDSGDDTGTESTPDDSGDDSATPDDSTPPDDSTDDSATETGDDSATDDSAPPIDTGIPYAGAASVADADGRYSSSESGTEIGRFVEAGDMTGDGEDDLLLCAMPIDGYAGGGFVLSGDLTESTDVAKVAWFLAGVPGSGAGRTVAVGDADDDGIDDAMLGAPYVDAGGGLLAFGPIDSDVDLAKGDVRLYGEADSYMGHAVDIADVTGDGIADAIVGAPGHDRSRGAAFVLNGPLIAGEVDLTTSADAMLYFEERDKVAVKIVRAGGDLDGDGTGDLLVPSMYDDIGGPVSGTVAVVLGPTGGELALTGADGALVGSQPYAEAGFALEMADVDGDGKDDAIVGAPLAGTDAGAVYVVAGPATGTVDLGTVTTVIEGTSIEQQVMDEIAAADLDLDGIADLFVGASQDDTAATNAGVAWLFYGPISGSYDGTDAYASVAGVDPGGGAGLGLELADTDGNTQPELVVVAPFEEGGTTYIFFP